MRLLRLQDVEISPKELVFRHARLRALIVWLAGRRHRRLIPQGIQSEVAARLHLRPVFIVLPASDCEIRHGALPSVQLARADERDGNLRAISLLSELSAASQ